MKGLFIHKPGVIGRWAAEWHLFKQQILYPAWYFYPEKYLRVNSHNPTQTSFETIRSDEIRRLKCHHCSKRGELYWDVNRLQWVLVGLDPGHQIGNDRDPSKRLDITNILPECRAYNEEKER